MLQIYGQRGVVSCLPFRASKLPPPYKNLLDFRDSGELVAYSCSTLMLLSILYFVSSSQTYHTCFSKLSFYFVVLASSTESHFQFTTFGVFSSARPLLNNYWFLHLLYPYILLGSACELASILPVHLNTLDISKSIYLTNLIAFTNHSNLLSFLTNFPSYQMLVYSLVYQTL